MVLCNFYIFCLDQKSTKETRGLKVLFSVFVGRTFIFQPNFLVLFSLCSISNSLYFLMETDFELILMFPSYKGAKNGSNTQNVEFLFKVWFWCFFLKIPCEIFCMHFYVPTTKWPGHIVLPMSVIPLCFEIWTWYLVCECIVISYRSSYVSFRSNDFWPSNGPWTLKFGQIFSCHHFNSLCLEKLTWFLVFECIMMSYRSSLHFVLVQWFLAELWPLDFEILPNI
jgi:hypothetical protein